MADIYKPSPEMQDIYDKDKEENKETDELIRQGKLKEAAKKKLGTRMFDAIEYGAVGSVQWLQKQAEENPNTYTDDVLRLLAVGIKNTAWAISKIPLLDKLAQGEDWLAKQARGLSEELTPWLDPRFAGWGTRIGTGILADKGIRKAVSGVQRGVRVSQALSKADEIMAARKNPALANVLMKQIDGDDIPLSQRMANADLSQVPQSAKDISRARDRFAAITKGRIKQFVEEFGGTAEDVDRIYKTELIRHSNQKKSVAWLNKYFEELITEVDDTGKLKQFNIAEVNGKPTLVDRSGKVQSSYKWAFEKDHSKAKTLFESLGIPGADFSDNLDIVLTVFNRAKNNLGNPSIPDDILRATGQSTSLRELVQRSIDKTFDAKFTRVPERYRSVARTQLMDDILNSTPIKGKPGKIRSQIIERHLKFWDENADLFVELDDWLPEFLLKDPAFFANPQEVLESLEGMRVYKSLTPTYKKRVKRLTDKWVTLNRGTQAVRDYFERQGRVIKKRYN